MLNGIYVVRPLQLRVFDEVLIGERSIDDDVDVAVDGGGEYEPSEPLVIGREIRATASERDTQRRPRDDHNRYPALAASSWNIFTVSSETSSSSRPMPSTFARRSCVTVMMSQPIAAAWQTFSTSRGLAHNNSTLALVLVSS